MSEKTDARDARKVAELNVWARENLGVCRDFKVIDAASKKEAEALLKEIAGKLNGLEDSRIQGHLTGAIGFLETAIDKYDAQVKAEKDKKEAGEKRRKEISDRHAKILKQEAEAGKN